MPAGATLNLPAHFRAGLRAYGENFQVSPATPLVWRLAPLNMLSIRKRVLTCSLLVINSRLCVWDWYQQADWVNSWSIWFPGYAAVYGLLPVHLRMPGVSVISFGYVCLLSFTRGAYKSDAKVPEGGGANKAHNGCATAPKL